MKATTIFFSLYIILAGLSFLVVVFGGEETKCGVNMYAQNCYPCNRVCNRGSPICAQYCLTENTLCKCNSGYYLPTSNSTYCVSKSECPAAT